MRSNLSKEVKNDFRKEPNKSTKKFEYNKKTCFDFKEEEIKFVLCP
jgi:hypothetical protein